VGHSRSFTACAARRAAGFAIYVAGALAFAVAAVVLALLRLNRDHRLVDRLRHRLRR
jgi:hypothetical protein